MSCGVGGGHQWEGFIRELEKEADPAATPQQPHSADLTIRAWSAMRRLRATKPKASLATIIQRCTGIQPGPGGGTAQLQALVRHRWPLVLTMNYDGWYEDAFKQFWQISKLPEVETLSRNAEDCWRAVRSLHTIKSPLCWAIHGTFEKPEDLIIAQTDYRRTLHDEPHFRRAIATVFRQRALLFLGTSLTDPHLNDVLDEDAHHLGGAALPRFAVLTGNDIDPAQAAFLGNERGITPICMPADKLPAWLEKLCPAHPSSSVPAAGFALDQTFQIEDTKVSVRLTSDPITAIDRESGHAWAFSAGINDRRWVVSPWLNKLGVKSPEGWVPDDGVGVVKSDTTSSRIWLVQSQTMHQKTWRRDLRGIGVHLCNLLERVVKDPPQVLHLNLIGAGMGSTDPAPWHLVTMLQAIRTVFRLPSAMRLRIEIHLVDRDVIAEILGGRLVPSAILAGPPWPVWLDASALGDTRQRQILADPHDTVDNLLARAGLPASQLDITVDPAPTPGGGTVDPDALMAKAGILPGATLVLMRRV